MANVSIKPFADAGDRRTEDRAATIFRPVLIETDEFAGFCLVRNISRHGMMGDVYTEFASELPITVQFGCGTVIEGKVLWCKAGRIGVHFAKAIDVAEILSSVAKKEIEGRINRAPRLAFQCSGEVLIGKRTLDIQVHDVSQRGIKAEASFIQAGDEVWVRLDGLDQKKAVVRWTQGRTAGLNFVRPLPFEELAQWVVHRHLEGERRSSHSMVEPLTSSTGSGH